LYPNVLLSSKLYPWAQTDLTLASYSNGSVLRFETSQTMAREACNTQEVQSPQRSHHLK